MTRNIASVRQLIEHKLQEVNPSPDWQDSIAIGPIGDMADTTQQVLTREMACRDLNRQAQMARNLRAALDRIDAGTYGACAHCEEPIAPKRLAAVPWAQLCLACQEEIEHSPVVPHDRAA
jgi:DnaK suppressor protein